MAEVYAGFLSHADHEIGRLLDYLEESGQLDNTMIVLVSDNGASGEGGPNGSVNENKIFNGLPDKIEENLPYLDVLGSPLTYNHYPTGWAWAFNTPFKMWKRYSNYEGGTADPMIVSWPKRITATGRPPPVHARGRHRPDDLRVPRHRAARGRQGLHAVPARGRQLRRDLRRRRRARPASRRSSTRWAAPGRSGTTGWKAAAISPAAPDAWADYATQRWELFDTETDPSECHDLADRAPGEAAGADRAVVGRRPASTARCRSRTAGVVEILATERPAAREAARPLRLLPRRRRGAGVGRAEHPQPLVHDRGRGRRSTPTEAGGVLFSHGARFGGHALYIKDGKLKYVYNFVGLLEQIVESTGPIPTGHVVFSASFEREGDAMPAEGTLTLHIGEEEVGEGRIKTQPGKFSIAGEGLNIGKDGAEPVTDDYPGDSPWAVRRRHDRAGRDRRQRRAVRRPRDGGEGGVRARLMSAGLADLERRRGEGGDCRLRRAGDDRGRGGLRPARRADRRLRQRRHALVREADADRARLHPQAPRRDGRRRTSRCGHDSRGRRRYETDYAWLGETITKHYARRRRPTSRC